MRFNSIPKENGVKNSMPIKIRQNEVSCSNNTSVTVELRPGQMRHFDGVCIQQDGFIHAVCDAILNRHGATHRENDRTACHIPCYKIRLFTDPWDREQYLCAVDFFMSTVEMVNIGSTTPERVG